MGYPLSTPMNLHYGKLDCDFEPASRKYYSRFLLGSGVRACRGGCLDGSGHIGHKSLHLLVIVVKTLSETDTAGVQ
eukprot:4692046-Amphidinium_carterae.1